MESKHTKGVARLFNPKEVLSKEESMGIDMLLEDKAVSILRYEVSNIPTETTGEEDLANAQLIVDAFNVTNETGMTPRELQKSHAELLEALKYCEEAIDVSFMNNSIIDESALSVIKQAITNATKKQS